MYQFLVDAWATLRLKFYPVTHYRYSLSITVLVLLTLGLINAASMPPFFTGTQAGLIGFAITLTVLRWLTLCLVMKNFLSPNSSLLAWSGYILVTEALMMPLVMLLYFPEIMAVPGFLWLGWIMTVQLIGFIQISKLKPSKIILAYVLYFFCAIFAGTILLFVFFNMGWLDLESTLKSMEQFMNLPDTYISGQ